MKKFIINSSFHQFYIADRELEPDAPTEWTDADAANHHLTAKHIAALSPISDIEARIISCGPGDSLPEFPDPIDFEVRTEIEVPSGKLGIYGWPWELEDQYDIAPGTCEILFRAYATGQVEQGGDYYLVKIEPKKGEQKAPEVNKASYPLP